MSYCGSSFIFMKIFAGVVLLCVALLLVKGFTFVFPSVKPVGYTVQNNMSNLTCASGEDYRVIKDCNFCSSYDMKFEQACQQTGNVQTVECFLSKEKHVLSCPYSTTYEIKKFCVFEACLFVLSVLFCLIVWWRRRSLDEFMYHRLKRQISAS
ncbi:uncharacterized protein LOC136087737 [Hydra vulgaris]|uniref:Uncharacterized protein LOC136087737 n=1 Tax=Hydra vulgaris TaxID=6087 RepID=A0ABM4CZ36_HYDVU